jgi:hypothetical protein
MVEVVPLPAALLPAAGEVFAGSHAEYPPFRHLFPDPAVRSRVLRRFFTATVRDALQFGAVDAALADGRLLGVAATGTSRPWASRRRRRAWASAAGWSPPGWPAPTPRGWRAT